MTHTRRRGPELEAAIYQATRDILTQDGLAGLTFAKVATQAATSKPVIYRRWDSPFALALEAIQDQIKTDNDGPLADLALTGTTLHDDLVQVFQRFTRSIDAFGQAFMSTWFSQLTPAQNTQVQAMIQRVQAGDLTAIDRALQRAVERGELHSTVFPDTLKLMPFDWLRYRAFTDQRVDAALIDQFVTDILVPAFQQNLRTD